jgi:hypothetical protein
MRAPDQSIIAKGYGLGGARLRPAHCRGLGCHGSFHFVLNDHNPCSVHSLLTYKVLVPIRPGRDHDES